MTDFVVVIPARYESTRLPGKALVDIAGRPMIAWVYEQARQSAAREVIVATDDGRIEQACARLGAHIEMTAAEHASGTERIAEVAIRLSWPDEQIVVNVQGDEPLLPPALINQVAALLAADADASIATLMTPVQNEQEFRDEHNAKVVTDDRGHALYFSRAPIPSVSDGSMPPNARRHIGLYAYRAGTLKRLAAAPPSDAELAEKLEQLRALHLGYRIAVRDALEVPPPGIDTEADLTAIRALVEDQAHR